LDPAKADAAATGAFHLYLLSPLVRNPRVFCSRSAVPPPADDESEIRSAGVGFGFWSEEIEEWPDLVLGLRGVSHCCASVDQVVVASSDSASVDDVRFDEVCDDSLGRALGDSDDLGDVSEPDVGVLGDTQEYLRVVREERPGCRGLSP
jgi:hypothetical protein